MTSGRERPVTVEILLALGSGVSPCLCACSCAPENIRKLGESAWFTDFGLKNYNRVDLPMRGYPRIVTLWMGHLHLEALS